VTLTGTERPGWMASSPASAQLRLTGSQFPALPLDLRLNSALNIALGADGGPVMKHQQEETPVRAQHGGQHDSNLGFLRDIELGVTLRFGKRHALLRDILEIVPGSVVELEQQVQEPVELLVGKRVIARGEVVVVGGNYGLRITEVISAVDRIDSLRN